MPKAMASAYTFGMHSCRTLVVSALCVALVGCNTSRSLSVDNLSSNKGGFQNRFYTGASLGQSRLNPDTEGTDFRVESTSALGTQLRLGYDVHNLLAVELDTALLGSSGLGLANTGVEYSAASLNALFYGFSGTQMRSRREGLSAFARLGYGVVSKVSIIDEFKYNGSVPILGVGAEYGFSNGLGIRTEITRFDSDVSYVGLGAIFRFGKSNKNSKARLAIPSVVEPRSPEVTEPTVVPTQLAALEQPARLLSKDAAPVAKLASDTPDGLDGLQPRQGRIADRWRPTKRDDDTDSDGVLDAQDACPLTPKFVTVGNNGCGLFDQILSDVTFTKGSRLLDPFARKQLNQVAQTLLAFPESRVQIQAHTDAEGAENRNLALSSRRAVAVSHYLRSRGVNQNQLQATGMGEAHPIAANSTAAGRLKNLRIELVTLPDLDADQLVLALPASTPAVNIQPIVNKQASKQASSQFSEQVSEQVSAQLGNENIGHPRERDGVEPKPLPVRLVKSPSKLPAVKSVSSQKQVAKEPLLLSAKVSPLPVPGYAPGLDIAGTVDGVEFEPKSFVLTEEGRIALEPIVRQLQSKPKVAIAVMAHTDESGDELENEQLTVKQAEAVIEYLVAEGIERARLQAEGYGALLPLVQNVTEEDRARNRRIEIRILPAWPKQPD